jgi:hypothetical protein
VWRVARAAVEQGTGPAGHGAGSQVDDGGLAARLAADRGEIALDEVEPGLLFRGRVADLHVLDMGDVRGHARVDVVAADIQLQ